MPLLLSRLAMIFELVFLDSELLEGRSHVLVMFISLISKTVLSSTVVTTYIWLIKLN